MSKITIEENLKTNGFHLSSVEGDSMMPLLREGVDMVKIVPANNILKKDELPLYRRPNGKYVLHRIRKVKKDHYIISGDNRGWSERVPFDWIVGVAEMFYIGEKEVSVTDARYLKYTKDVRKKYWVRWIKHKMKKVLAR